MNHRTERSAGLWSGAFAALLATVIGYIAYESAGWFFWPDAFAQWVFAVVPGPIQAELIATLGFDAKALGFYAAMLAQIIAGGLIGLTLQRASGITLGALVTAALGLTTPAFVLSVPAVQLPGWIDLGAGGLTTAAIFGALVPSLRRYLIPASSAHQTGQVPSDETPAASESEPRSSEPWTRRRMLARLGTVAGTAALWPWVRANLRPSSGEGAASTAVSDGVAERAQAVQPGTVDFDAIPDLSPWLTPEEEFYYVSKNITVYRTGVPTWEPLRVEGLVDSPMALQLADVQETESFDQHATLVCIDYQADKPNTRDLMSNGRWTGISFRSLLERAGVQSKARDLELRAADGYSDSLPVELVMDHPEIMLAWALNGEALSPKHGFPLRVIIPGHYGVKNVKHIQTIVATEEDYKGYWQSRNWSDDCEIHPFAKVETPSQHAQVPAAQPAAIAGVAYAGLRGVSRVEVSTDDGRTWHEAQIEPQENAPYSWRRWAYAWQPAQTGQHTLLARVVDGQGRTQTAEKTSAFPDGSTGYDRVWVTATSA